MGSVGQADGQGRALSQQPWGGRFGEEPDPLIDRFTRSLAVDQRLAREDIAGSRAYARALVGAGVLTTDEQATIDQALQEIASEFPDLSHFPPPRGETQAHFPPPRGETQPHFPPLRGETQPHFPPPRGEAQAHFPPPRGETQAHFPPPRGEGQGGGSFEDIHMLVEQKLREKLGPLGGKLHTGRSRNDQVAVDVRLFVRSIGAQLIEAVSALQSALIARAKEHVDTVMPGYTHTQRAQPVLLAHHLLAYVEMLARDRGRLQDALQRADVSPLGAGALAGSGFPIDRVALAHDLGFKTASANSLDAVADRDFVLELIAACNITMIHLSRLCGEIVLWTSAEFSFASLPDALASGSSMMPNKKNPCAAELVRAKSGRVTGDLVNLLMVLKGLPLAYNRDLQEDKEALFDAVDTTLACLQVTALLVKGLRFDVDVMRSAAINGYTLATELADYLSRKGMPFRDAHWVVGNMVATAVASHRGLESFSLDELRQFSPLFDSDVADHLTLEGALKSRDVVGGTAPNRVREALASVEA